MVELSALSEQIHSGSALKLLLRLPDFDIADFSWVTAQVKVECVRVNEPQLQPGRTSSTPLRK